MSVVDCKSFVGSLNGSYGSPAEILATLRNDGNQVIPTERWDGNWKPEYTTTEPNVYGLYARAIPLYKWLDSGVRDLLEHYPQDVGSGEMPGGLKGCSIEGTADPLAPHLGNWVLLYVGESNSKTPRIVQYFGQTEHFTREPGGQSLHLSLALFFGGGSDPREAEGAVTVEHVLRESLSLRLESRMRNMHLSYVQVETPGCTDLGAHSNCYCKDGEERVLRNLSGAVLSTEVRPLFNARW